jgi:hypothetical protein
MKTKILLLLCAGGGALLSLAWESPLEKTTARQEPQRGSAERFSTRELRGFREFDVKVVIAEIVEYDEAEDVDPRLENRLRMLMFSVPADHIGSVISTLDDTKNKGRFNGVVTALYARWAEFDAPAAWDAAINDRHARYARHGAMITWLSQDRETAFRALLESPDQKNQQILVEFLRNDVLVSPRRAAQFVDRIAGDWPEVDGRIFPLVAKSWAIVDPLAAGEWVASNSDSVMRNQLLHELAKQTVREYKHGLLGLELANRIDDPVMRKNARLNAIRWFGVATGSQALKDKRARPNADLRAGFPDDWSGDELAMFVRGCMVNYVEDYPLLPLVAKGEDQLQSIYLGAIQGAGFSRPDLVADAAAALDPAVIDGNAEHRESLQQFIRRWDENDSVAARKWLGEQPDDSKSRAMKEILFKSSEDQ